MNWEQLLSAKRLGLEHYHKPDSRSRTQFQRDYDRVIFSPSFRRLQNKTQVFPLPGRIFVHNRLTHSLEVASVGRSLGNEIWLRVQEKRHVEIPDLSGVVSAACLVHDLGNPPFGHSGEKVISDFFSECAEDGFKTNFSEAEWNDLTNFEGNANAFRLLTHQYDGKRDGGFVMTYATLASTVKYPYDSSVNPGKKYGFFQSEKEIYKRIANELGIVELDSSKGVYARHPLVYLVEAADDICYQIMDVEDAHKLGILSTEKTFELFLGFFEDKDRKHLEETLVHVGDKNEQVSYLRASVIGKLIQACCDLFMQNEDEILSGTYSGTMIKNLTNNIGKAYLHCSEVAVSRIYNAPEVVEIEIAGYKILNTLMKVYVDAVQHPGRFYSKQLLSRVPSQYVLEEGLTYRTMQGVVDFVSGMTDVYALDLYRKITGISIPGVDVMN